MLNLEYKNWLIPYVEGTLDARRKAILESRLKIDNNLAAEVDLLRNVSVHLRTSAGANRAIQVERSVWPRVEAVIADRKGGVVYSPRFALAGGLAVVAIVAVTWIGGGLNGPPPATRTVASSSSKPSTNSAPVPHGSALAPPVAPPVHRDPIVAANNTAPSAPPVLSRHDDGPRLAFGSMVQSHHPRVDVISDPGGDDLHSPFAVDSDNVMRPSSRVSTDPATTPNQSKPSASTVMANGYHVDSNDAITPWTALNGAAMNSTTRPGDALLHINVPRMNGTRGNKAVSTGTVMSMPASAVNLSSHTDDSLSTLRNFSVNLINNARPETVHEALNSWRDALMVDLNTTVDQNSTTSSQADETLGLLRGTGHLTDFYALMRDECQSRPQEVESQRALAHVDAALGKTDEAVNAWVEVTKSSAASAEDWYQLGLALEANHNGASAVAVYKTVLEIGEASRTVDAESHLAALQN